MTHPLVAFLEARFAEEQAEATKAMPSDREPEYVWGMDVLGRDRYSTEVQDAVVMRYWPGRVLAEIHAKRGILNRHTATDGGKGWNGWERSNGLVCTECGNADANPINWPCTTLKWLGQPYQDHEDYQGAWSVLAPC